MKTFTAKTFLQKTFIAKLLAAIILPSLVGLIQSGIAQDPYGIPPDDGSKNPPSRGNGYQQPYYSQPATAPGFGSSVRSDSWPAGTPAANAAAAANAAGPAPAYAGGNPNGIPSGPIGPGSMMPGPTFIPSQVPPNPPSGPQSGPPMPTAVPCVGSIKVAQVGPQVILTSDLQASVDEFCGRFKSKIPKPEQYEAQRAHVAEESAAGIAQLAVHWSAPDPGSFVDAQRRMLLYQMTTVLLENEMLYLDFLRTVPKEALPNVEETVGRHFDDTELAILLKRENAVSREELETKLRAKGSSLEREKTAFSHRIIAQQWIREKVNPDKEITHEQMLEYYDKHIADYQKPAKAHWEELAVQFSKFPNKDAAYAAMAEMGNQVLLGAPFVAVAKARSQGITAASGGDRGWNTKGSLSAKAIDDTLFGPLAVGQLSPILESTSGYHIVRLVAQEAFTTTPFSKVQSEIKDKIKKERLDNGYNEFMVKIRKQYPIWTVFDAANKRAAELANTPSILNEP